MAILLKSSTLRPVLEAVLLVHEGTLDSGVENRVFIRYHNGLLMIIAHNEWVDFQAIVRVQQPTVSSSWAGACDASLLFPRSLQQPMVRLDWTPGGLRAEHGDLSLLVPLHPASIGALIAERTVSHARTTSSPLPPMAVEDLRRVLELCQGSGSVTTRVTQGGDLQVSQVDQEAGVVLKMVARILPQSPRGKIRATI